MQGTSYLALKDMWPRDALRLLAVLCLIAVALTARVSFAASELFGDKPSRGELDAIQQSGKAAGNALKALAQLQKLLVVQQMQQGDCKPALEIEGQAKSGDADQQLQLGELYVAGLCVAKDPATAAQWFDKASKQGNSEASRILGLAFQDGQGVEKNQSLAVSYMEKAAEAGDVPAMVLLARYLLEGSGVPQNPARGAAWLEKAAAQGDAEAHTRLGFLYSSGEKVPRDLALSVKNFLVAADQGAPLAQLGAGSVLMELGSLVEAHKWLNLASASEFEKISQLAVKSRTELETQLTPSDLEQARALASAWEPKTQDNPASLDGATDIPDYPIAKARGLGKREAILELQRIGVPVSKDAFFDAVKADKLGVFILFHRAGASLNERWGLTSGVTPLYLA